MYDPLLTTPNLFVFPSLLTLHLGKLLSNSGWAKALSPDVKIPIAYFWVFRSALLPNTDMYTSGHKRDRHTNKWLRPPLSLPPPSRRRYHN